MPEGAPSVAAGLAVLGVTVYAFLTVAARALGPARYAALSAMWALVFMAGPGMFFPIEQEVSRSVARRLTDGGGAAPVLRRAGVVAVVLAVLLALLTVTFRGPILDRLFDNQPLVLIGFVTSLFGYAALHLARGVFSGSGRFRAYAVLLGGEGLLRLVGAGALLVFGVRTAGAFALIVGITPFAAVAVAVAMASKRQLLKSGPPTPWGELSRSLGFLLLGSLLAQVLIHGGPVAVKLVSTDSSEAITAQFFAGVLLTRVPLFLFAAVQASLLPNLAGFAARGDRSGFNRTLNRLLLFLGFLGALSVGGAFFFGQSALRLLFGAQFLLDGRGLALLAASSATIMVAQALGQALIALDGQKLVAACWAAGVAAFILVTAIGHDPLLRVELGLVVGSSVAAAAMGMGLVPRAGRIGVIGAPLPTPLSFSYDPTA